MLKFESGMDMFVWSQAFMKPDAKIETESTLYLLQRYPLNVMLLECDYLVTDLDRTKLEKYRGAILTELKEQSVAVVYYATDDDLNAAWAKLESENVVLTPMGAL